MGDAGADAPGNTIGWNFRGNRIVRAIIRDLVEQHGMGTNGLGERLLFGGCSAGSRGAMANLDFIQPLVPAGVQARARARRTCTHAECPCLSGTRTRFRGARGRKRQ